MKICLILGFGCANNAHHQHDTILLRYMTFYTSPWYGQLEQKQGKPILVINDLNVIESLLEVNIMHVHIQFTAVFIRMSYLIQRIQKTIIWKLTHGQTKQSCPL